MNTALGPAIRAPGPAGATSSRTLGLLGLTAAVAAFITFLVAAVPLMAPRLARGDAVRHWDAAVVAAGAVLVVVLLVISVTQKRAAAHPRERVRPARRSGIPVALSRERVSRRAVEAAAIASAVLLGLAALAGAPLEVGGLALLVCWAPVVLAEATWKYEHYGAFAIFAMLVLLQVLHMGEHTVQVTQLLATDGVLARSHGVFGQLDFEAVHFVTDTGVWLSLGAFLYVFGMRNVWLWVAFGVASLHQIEHFYLFWIYTTQNSLYDAGGFAGIMGSGGLIGSPLDRPYLHFTYNFLVTVPMVLALWDQARSEDASTERRRAGR